MNWILFILVSVGDNHVQVDDVARYATQAECERAGIAFMREKDPRDPNYKRAGFVCTERKVL